MSMNAMQQLSSILQSELNLSSQLSQLLQQEREALKNADLNQLQLLTQQKQPHVVQLEQLGRQREQLLKAAGFPGGKAGLSLFVAHAYTTSPSNVGGNVTPFCPTTLVFIFSRSS